MIDSLRIGALQSHQGTEVHFGPGLNVIVGPSDSGKTAILRALRWLVENKPSGEGLVPNGQEEAEVELSVDGKTVRRYRCKTTNEYWLDNQKFVAFGRDVPAPIAAVLNMDDINLQRQMDGPFLLTQSGQEVARFLNRMVDLDVIGRTLRNAVSAERACVRREQDCERDVVRLQQEAEQFGDLPRAEELLEVVLERWEKVQAFERNCNELKKLIGRWDGVVQREQELIPIARMTEAQGLLEEAAKLIPDLQWYEKQIADLQRLDSRWAWLEQKIDAVQVPDTELLEYAQGLLENWQTAECSRNELLELVEAYAGAAIGLKNTSQELADLEKEYEQVFPDECPLCGRAA